MVIGNAERAVRNGQTSSFQGANNGAVMVNGNGVNGIFIPRLDGRMVPAAQDPATGRWVPAATDAEFAAQSGQGVRVG
jgi:hypothetical protein